MAARFTGIKRAIAHLNADKQEQLQRIEAIKQEIVYLLAVRKKSGEGIHCAIKEVAGDTLVRTQVSHNGINAFKNSNASELRIKLREQGLPHERVFFNDAGSLDWDFEVPDFAP